MLNFNTIETNSNPNQTVPFSTSWAQLLKTCSWARTKWMHIGSMCGSLNTLVSPLTPIVLRTARLGLRNQIMRSERTSETGTPIEGVKDTCFRSWVNPRQGVKTSLQQGWRMDHLKCMDRRFIVRCVLSVSSRCVSFFRVRMTGCSVTVRISSPLARGLWSPLVGSSSWVCQMRRFGSKNTKHR